MKILWTKRAFLLTLLMCSLMVFAVGSQGNSRRGKVTADLDGYQEVPSISSEGSGEFEATINALSIDYKLSYEDLEGAALRAHIHFAQRGVNGEVMIDLCGEYQASLPSQRRDRDGYHKAGRCQTNSGPGD